MWDPEDRLETIVKKGSLWLTYITAAYQSNVPQTNHEEGEKSSFLWYQEKKQNKQQLIIQWD